MPKIVKKSAWRGQRRQGGIASVGEDQLYTISNGRWDSGGNITERGGQTKLLGSALSPTLITGMYDSSMGGSLVGGTSGGGGGGGPIGTGGGGGGSSSTGDGPKIYWPADTSGPSARWVMFMDEEKSGAPVASNIFEINTTAAQTEPVSGQLMSVPTFSGIQWAGRLWWVLYDTTGWGLYSQEPVFGTNYTQPVRQTFKLVTMTAPRAALCTWRGKLYFSITTAATSNLLTYEYDGTTLKQFDDSGFAATATGQPVGYQDKLYVVYNQGNNVIRVVSIAGTGANATMPGANFSCVGATGAWAEYKGVLYCGGIQTGSTSCILSTTTSTFAVARDLQATASATSAPLLFVFNDYLYYSWATAGPARLRIGRFDGTTWTDTHKDFGASTEPMQLSQWFRYKGDLCFTSATANPIVTAYRSSGTDTTTWTALQSGSAAGRERIARVVPFY